MLAQRWEFTVTPGGAPAIVAHLKEGLGFPKAPQFKRIYTHPIGGKYHRVVVEFEWESLADCEKAWAAYGATPAAPARFKKLETLFIESAQEIWHVSAT